jgi:hypothetical protein
LSAGHCSTEILIRGGKCIFTGDRRAMGPAIPRTVQASNEALRDDSVTMGGRGVWTVSFWTCCWRSVACRTPASKQTNWPRVFRCGDAIARPEWHQSVSLDASPLTVRDTARSGVLLRLVTQRYGTDVDRKMCMPPLTFHEFDNRRVNAGHRRGLL